ncbi:hypothetical protein [Sulfuriferula sp.]|uniref:hypothetical protein n=1 Tax=Sulfuriferula sp. TaxID=2025307 RepID=UPI00273084C2|nr:hypothetical protein [Sulfuriferula sp.]MDP2026443.1 hypothetical protein [Sulfuriferula sp.]
MSLVTDSAYLGAAFANITAGKFFRYINNTAAVQAVNFAGATAGTKTTASIFARITGGNATLQAVTAGTPSGAVPLNANTAFVQFYSENCTTTAASSTLQLSVPAGVTVEFLLNQFETSHATLASVLTTPIIVLGVAASRLGTTLKFTDALQRTPANDFTVYCELEATSESQQYGAQAYWHLYGDVNNGYLLGAGGGNTQALHKMVVGVQVDSVGKLFNIKRTTHVAAHFSGARGVELFVNGSVPNHPILQTDPITLGAAMVCSIGQYNANAFDNVYTGWVKNFRIYGGAQPQQVLRALTQRYTDVTFLGQRGIPIHDKNNAARIWSLRLNPVSNAYDAIEYSDDWGSTWFTWHVLINKASSDTLHMDSQGNFYYSQQAAGPTYDGLWRVDAVAKSELQVQVWGNWNYGTLVLDKNKTGKHNWYPWTWGEDASGRLFTASYYTTVTDGGAILYVSTNWGLTWTPFTGLATTYTTSKHIHSCHVNPADNSLWVTMGDLQRATSRNTDGLATMPVVVTNTPLGQAALDGPTGLTFTSEAVWTATDGGDFSPYQNYLSNSIGAAAFNTAWAVPVPMQSSPLYYARAAGDNEMWVLGWDETQASNRSGCLFMLTKKPGAGSPWSIAKAIYGLDTTSDGGMPFALAHNGNGVIPPACPYVFVQVRRTTAPNNPYPKDRTIARILRGSIAPGIPQTVRSMFREI